MKILAGPYAGMEAEILSDEGDTVTADVMIFGRSMRATLAKSDLDIAADPATLRQRLRDHLTARRKQHLRMQEREHWVARARSSEAHRDPLPLWLSYVAWRDELAAKLDTELAAFDALPDDAIETRSRDLRIEAFVGARGEWRVVSRPWRRTRALATMRRRTRSPSSLHGRATAASSGARRNGSMRPPSSRRTEHRGASSPGMQGSP